MFDAKMGMGSATACPTKPWRSGVPRPPQAHCKNAEGVLSFSLGLPRNFRGYPRFPSLILLGLNAEGLAQSRYIGTSASLSALQLKTKNLSLTISQKIGKVMQGHASVLTPSPGTPLALRPQPPAFPTKSLIFMCFIHNPTVNLSRFLPTKTCELTPKMMQFMNDFCSSRFVNNNQRFCLRSCQFLRPHFFLFPF